MARSLVVHHGAWRLLLAVIVALALVLTLDAGSATAASKGCSVKNKATGRSYSTLQAAVNAAKPKATLLVRGTCGGKTVIGKSLRIRGAPGGGWGVPRLQAAATPVLAIQRGAMITVSSLLIAKGKGVINRGNTTFIDVRVKGDNYDFATPEGKGERRGILNTGMEEARPSRDGPVSTYPSSGYRRGTQKTCLMRVSPLRIWST